MPCLCGRCGNGVGRAVCRHCGHRCDSFVRVDYLGMGPFPDGVCPRCGCPAARPLNDPAPPPRVVPWPWPPDLERRVQAAIAELVSSR